MSKILEGLKIAGLSAPVVAVVLGAVFWQLMIY
jgi:hypothetical protein